MDESILVCVYYGPNGERLIRRGLELASMLDCPLYILTIEQLPQEEIDTGRTDYIERCKQIAEKSCAEEYIIKYNEKRPVTKVIAEVAREKDITQVIIGQSAQSRWQEITKGSIINILLNELPFVDLHIVSIARHLEHREGYFQKGVRAYLLKDEECYHLSFSHTNDFIYEGIFFKETGTDFNNGVFRYLDGYKAIQIHINDNCAKDLKNISITGPGSETELWEEEL